jgi:hypothetical protein
MFHQAMIQSQDHVSDLHFPLPLPTPAEIEPQEREWESKLLFLDWKCRTVTSHWLVTLWLRFCRRRFEM